MKADMDVVWVTQEDEQALRESLKDSSVNSRDKFSVMSRPKCGS